MICHAKFNFPVFSAAVAVARAAAVAVAATATATVAVAAAAAAVAGAVAAVAATVAAAAAVAIAVAAATAVAAVVEVEVIHGFIEPGVTTCTLSNIPPTAITSDGLSSLSMIIIKIKQKQKNCYWTYNVCKFLIFPKVLLGKVVIKFMSSFLE